MNTILIKHSVKAFSCVIDKWNETIIIHHNYHRSIQSALISKCSLRLSLSDSPTKSDEKGAEYWRVIFCSVISKGFLVTCSELTIRWMACIWACLSMRICQCCCRVLFRYGMDVSVQPHVLYSSLLKRSFIAIARLSICLCSLSATALVERERATEFPMCRAFSPFPVERHMFKSLNECMDALLAIRLYVGNRIIISTVEIGLL